MARSLRCSSPPQHDHYVGSCWGPRLVWDVRCAHRKAPLAKGSIPPIRGKCPAGTKGVGRRATKWRGILTEAIFGIPQSRPRKVHSTRDAQAWASLAAFPCSSSPHKTRSAGLLWGPHLVRFMHHVGPDASSGPKPPVRRARRPGAPRRRKFHIIHFRRDGENSFAPLLLLSPTKPSALPGAPPLSQGGLGAGGHVGPPLRRISFVVFVGADVLTGSPSRT